MEPAPGVRSNQNEILIVEDSATQVEQLKYLLEEHGYKPAVASTGEQALAMARQRKPSLVISDIVMPEMDGYTLCKQLKSDKELKDVPVLLLTSLSGAEEVLKALQCGADNFVRKPYDDKRLLSLTEYMLTNRELRKSAKMQLGLEIEIGGERHFITSERQQLLDLLVSTFTEAIQLNVELTAREEELARSYQSLKGLYGIAEALNQASYEQDVLNSALQQMLHLPGVQAGWVSLLEEETGVRLAAACALPPALEVPGAFEGDCECRRKLLAGELGQMTNILECERLREATGDTRGLRYHASIPLWIGNTVVGVMNLAGPGEGLLENQDLDILYSVGNQVAVALERTRLLQQMEKKVEERTAALRAEIAERRRAEEALRISEERLRDFLDNASDLIQSVAPDGRFLYVNRAWREKLGYSQEDVPSLSLLDIIHPDHRASGLELFQALLAGKAFNNIETIFVAKDGRSIHVSGDANCRFEGATPVATRGIYRDITERKQLETQLFLSQKMEAIGRLAGGVAHDFNNHLGIIMGHSDLLLEGLGSEGPLRKRAAIIKDAAQRAASLTRQLLAFSRRQVFEARILDLNAVISDLGKMLRPLIGEDIELVVSLDPMLGKVKADPTQIDQVIMNLAVNARDAMPQGGRLTIETTNASLDEAYARTHVTVKPGPYVMLAVSDTGIGMEKETQSHIFEPFFTTKGRDKGTGLGLATVYGIVKQSGGYIWVYSEPNHGTAFKIYLPRWEEAHPAAAPERVSPAVLKGEETVLVVEDEGILRELAREFLESGGYAVLEAGNGAEAIEISKRHPGPIHLLMTDVVMPGMSGRELALQLQADRAEIKVLYVSGYTDDVVLRTGLLDPATAFLQKPFTKDSLTQKVRAVLDRGKGTTVNG